MGVLVMNKALLKFNVFSNYRLFGIVGFVLLGLVVLVMGVFDPEAFVQLNSAQSSLPINPLGDTSSLNALLANQYFGLFVILLSMIYVIFASYGLIGAKVERGDLAYLLSSPISRGSIVGSGIFYLVSSLVFLFLLIAGVGVGTAEFFQPGVLDVDVFLYLTLGCFLLIFAYGGISFLAGCLFNSSGRVMAIGGGLPVMFFSLSMVSNISEDLSFFRYFTINSLFDSGAVLEGSGFMPGFIALFLLGTLCYVISAFVFRKRNFSL
jgi:ABC-2 type transport system permease protein